ncbi:MULTISPECIES: Zn-ribbon domain-containing OB-fold protein [Streptomyces]|uniref:Zinc ribbon domain-containing protein n=1 Tax=Streptomyces yangpuensis TaxID=1648182 RepID=A0ABY5PS00_9ACTN|nr:MULTISPECIES: zinc ribbon domain-containing protein [Streptomyces]UUY46789.1 zinc ribbon domain-containing protein [Streptomyces yangpuensis]
MARTRTPVVSGWFTENAPGGGGFRLLGTRCSACTAVFFPREDTYCRNPRCPGGGELAEVPLSARGRVWSCTDGRYRPPAPYVSDPAEPWEPYTLVAVELEAEGMVVLGQAAPGIGVADLAVGTEVEVVGGVLDEDAETTWVTWRFRPVGGSS